MKLNTATLTVQPYYLRFAADLLNHSNVLYKSFEPVDDTGSDVHAVLDIARTLPLTSRRATDWLREKDKHS